jgi:hypothetical protein
VHFGHENNDDRRDHLDASAGMYIGKTIRCQLAFMARVSRFLRRVRGSKDAMKEYCSLILTPDVEARPNRHPGNDQRRLSESSVLYN